MEYESADEFMAHLKKKVDTRGCSTELSRAAFIEGTTWGMVTELIIERNQLRESLEATRKDL